MYLQQVTKSTARLQVETYLLVFVGYYRGRDQPSLGDVAYYDASAA